MGTFTTSDRTTLFYRDWGHGPPIIFVASWALDSRAWARHMLHFNELGHRCIALDRRGHGRSDDPGHGYTLDRLADDLAELLEHLDVRDATIVTHSMGSAECTRYLARHGSARVAGAVFLAPTAPDVHPSDAALHDAMNDAVIDAIRRDLPRWLADNAEAFFLPAETGTTPEFVQHTINLILDCSLQALIDCFHARHTDLRAELRAIDIPLLVLHGDRDASDPVEYGRATAALAPHGVYVEYAGAPHGLYHTHFHRVVRDVHAFLGAAAARAA